MPGRSGGACTVTAQPHLASGWAGLDGWCWRWGMCFSPLLSLCPGQSHSSTWGTGIARGLFWCSWPTAELFTLVCWWNHLHLWHGAGCKGVAEQILPECSPVCPGGTPCLRNPLSRWQWSSSVLVTEVRAVGWEPVLPQPWHGAALAAGVFCCSPPRTELVGLVAAHPTSSPSPRFHLSLFTAWCTTASWQTWLCHMQGAGWTPQPLPTWTDGRAGAQWDCDLGLSEGALERQFTNSCHPMETPARGISKISSLSKAEASPSWFPKATQDAGAFPNPSKSRAEGQQWPERAPWAQRPAGVFKGGSSPTQWGEEPGPICGISSPYPQLLCATNKCFRETAQTWTFELGTGSGKCLSHSGKASGTCSPSSCSSQSLELLLCSSTAPTPHLGLHPPAAQAKSEQGTSPVAGKLVFPQGQ